LERSAAHSSQPKQQPGPRHQGWVWKRGHLNTAYRKRWFVLADGVLSYYRDTEYYLSRRPPQGTLNCSGLAVESLGTCEHGFVFSLRDAEHGKDLICAVGSQHERSQWVVALEEASLETRSLPIDHGKLLTQKEADELIIRHQRRESRRAGGWKLRIFGIGKGLVGTLPASRLIHPSSPFTLSVLIVSAFCQVIDGYIYCLLKSVRCVSGDEPLSADDHC